jgi:dynein heavy chain
MRNITKPKMPEGGSVMD